MIMLIRPVASQVGKSGVTASVLDLSVLQRLIKSFPDVSGPAHV